jgi:hypothetical protein
VSVREQPQPATDVTDDEVCHWFCCQPDLALCGADLTGMAPGGPNDIDCPLCVLVAERPCVRCGV